jgi:TRAP-type C4-dicarboxylate transport system substrate-binding protein
MCSARNGGLFGDSKARSPVRSQGAYSPPLGVTIDARPRSGTLPTRAGRTIIARIARGRALVGGRNASMKPMKLAAAVALLASAVVLAPLPAAAQEVTLRIHTFMPPVANPVRHFLIPWAEKVTKESNGRIKAQVFPAMQLGGNPAQLLQQVRDGVVDAIWTLPGFTPGIIVKDEVFELPFVHRNTRSTVMALQDFSEQHLQKELAPYHPLLVHAQAGSLYMTKNTINTVEDFKGLKLRTPSRTSAWIVEAVGGAPVQVALPELAPMLSKGTVSGAILTYEIAPAVKMQDLVDQFTTFAGNQPRMGTTVFMFLMNKAKYESLPPDLKKVIDDNSGRNLAPFAIQVWDMIDQEGLKVMQSKPKNRFVTLSDAETEKYKKAVQPVFGRFKEEVDKSGGDGGKVIADAQALVEKYSK